MPVIKMDDISRSTLRRHPDWLFLFGDNDKRAGFGGHAHAMRGEPNAIGIRTKLSPSMKDQAFFTDASYDEAVAMIDADLRPAFEAARAGQIIIVPKSGLDGPGGELDRRAPRVAAHLAKRLLELEAIGAQEAGAAAVAALAS